MYYVSFIVKEREGSKHVEECPVQKILIKPFRWNLTLKLCDGHMHWRLNKTQMLASRTANLERLKQATNICLTKMFRVKRSDMLVELQLPVLPDRSSSMACTDFDGDEVRRSAVIVSQSLRLECS